MTVSLLAGAVVPILFTPSRVAALGAKVSVPAGDQAAAAVAFEVVGFGSDVWYSPHAMVTFSGPKANYTIGVGAVFDHAFSAAGLAMASADWRVAPKVSVLAELGALVGSLPNGPGTMFIPNVGVRFYVKQFSFYAGFVTFDASFGQGGTPIPLPFGNVAWHWDPPQKKPPGARLHSGRVHLARVIRGGVSDTPQKLKELIVRVLMLEGIAPDDIQDEAPLFGPAGMGLDSVDALELAIHIEEQFGVKLPDDADGKRVFTSVSTLAAFVASAAG